MFSFNSGVLHIPQELIDDEHPQRFESFDGLGLLDFFVEELRMGLPTIVIKPGPRRNPVKEVDQQITGLISGWVVQQVSH